MNKKDLQCVQHIAVYCQEISETIKRFGSDFDVFYNDNDYYKSVAMTIYQIDELSTHLTDDFKNSTKEQMPWAAIRGIRNMYAHEYVKIDKNVIWQVANVNIPELLKFCEKIMKEAAL